MGEPIDSIAPPSFVIHPAHTHLKSGISMLKAPFQLFMDFNMSKSEFGIINIKGRDRAEQNIVQMIVQGYFNGVVPIVDHEEGCPLRSEERRVGKECRYRWWRYH